jgi:FHA domain-containing protein
LPPPRRSGPAPSGEPSPEALWQAFCEGAGISLPLPDGLNPEMMRVMGRVMHHAVEGTLKLIAVRAAAKQELRAQVTTIQSKNNNPLKFSANAQQALAQLLQPPVRGFMSGPEAVRDAMDDLLGHNIGTMAGTRAALQGMLKRFEPARLEAGLSGKGVIDAVLPMNRRARLWELYVEHYARVQDDAQEDFHELFGKAFVKAYEQQLDRLAAARRKAD